MMFVGMFVVCGALLSLTINVLNAPGCGIAITLRFGDGDDGNVRK